MQQPPQPQQPQQQAQPQPQPQPPQQVEQLVSPTPFLAPPTLTAQDIIVDGRFKLLSYLGGGSFGQVFKALDLRTQQPLALKLENRRDNDRMTSEYRMTEALDRCHGFPRVLYYYAKVDDFRVLGLELLGPSLGDLRRYCGGSFSVKTTLMIAIQLLARLQHMHKNCHLVHRDLKPENFLMGIGRRGHMVYLTDMGLSQAKFVAPNDPMHYRVVVEPGLVGTPHWASLAAHRLHAQTYRDDLESLGYILLEFVLGGLPWSNPQPVDGLTPAQRRVHLKQLTTPQQLCQGAPDCFRQYFDYVTTQLAYNDVPDYKRLIKMFKKEFWDRRYQFDNVYDWTRRRYAEFRVVD
ncbi:kinase-like protein [Aspergillus heteromorphus CBS 117.55]|uniref:non-specific serine/threonine protein kinase n=1 Tax=Aspergillus heteromorphus CBS 117.55 TaxID=1448321 RepID=A0A317V953_9EURO|nr:kinase-like protein [Aspergillus heteromorphus CBS 117.55]PWY70904.1 kinase-like protein [Aspergillus heteromorphus CBS 117.55]